MKLFIIEKKQEIVHRRQNRQILKETTLELPTSTTELVIHG